MKPVVIPEDARLTHKDRHFYSRTSLFGVLETARVDFNSGHRSACTIARNRLADDGRPDADSGRLSAALAGACGSTLGSDSATRDISAANEDEDVLVGVGIEGGCGRVPSDDDPRDVFRLEPWLPGSSAPASSSAARTSSPLATSSGVDPSPPDA